MIPVQLQDSQSFITKPFQSTFPCKPDSPSLDFLELVSTNNPSASTLSVNEDYSSTPAEDDMSKSLTEFDTLVFRLSKRVRKQKKIAKQQQDQTLVEIISKRAYTKPIKTDSSISGSPTKEIITKKRKLNGETSQQNTKIAIEAEKKSESGEEPGSQDAIDGIGRPQLVFKDGKVQLETPQIIRERKQDVPLEIVKINQKKVTTSSSFKKSTHTEKWTTKETKKFYRALELFGTDFAMITKLFQNRNRNQIKNKFLREEKTAPERVDAIFKKPKPVNFEKLMNQYQKKSTKPQGHPNQSIISKATLLAQTQQESIRKRSESFHSMASLDSVDMAIMEDLSEAFVPSRQNIGLPSSIMQGSLKKF